MILFRDYETRSILDLGNVGAWKYLTHPSTLVLCCGFVVDDGEVHIWKPGDAVPEAFIEAARNPEFVVSAYNDSFERLVEQFIMGPVHNWPVIPLERHRCTMAAANSLALPGKLVRVAKALNLAEQKDMLGHKNMLLLASPRKARKGEDLSTVYWNDDPTRHEINYKYCMQDARVERCLHAAVGHLSPAEQVLWECGERINDRGLYIDSKLAIGAIKIDEEAHADLNAELLEITGGAVPSVTQIPKMRAWLAEQDCPTEDFTKETVRRALTRKNLSEAARRVLELRRDGAHVAADKFIAMMNQVNADGRVRGSFKHHGASTGRWTSHDVQMQNLKRARADDMQKAIDAVTTGSLAHLVSLYPQEPMSVVGDTVRGALCAAPGNQFSDADFSGVESRLGAWLAGQQSKVDQWAKFDETGLPGDEPYYLFELVLRIPKDKARGAGKTPDLAFMYQGGVDAYRKQAPNSTATDAEIKGYQRAWKDAHPAIVKCWYDLERAAIRAVHERGKTFHVNSRVAFVCDENFLRMKLPSGRYLAYPFPKLIRRKGRNGCDETAVSFMDNEKGKWVEFRGGTGAYGGIWMNNMVQGTARDIQAAAMMRLEAAGFATTLHVHDEICCEAPIGTGDIKEFVRIITERPAWAKGLPIAAKGRVGPRFCKVEPVIAATVAAAVGEAPVSGTVVTSEPVVRAPMTEAPMIHASMTEPVSATPSLCERAGLEFAEPAENGEHRPDALDEEYSDQVNYTTRPDFTMNPNFTVHDNKKRSDSMLDSYSSGEEEPHGPTVAAYTYRDSNGTPYLRVERKSNKKFPQYHLENGRWVKGAPKGPRFPYRLPELLKAPPNMPIWICEGEKDATISRRLVSLQPQTQAAGRKGTGPATSTSGSRDGTPAIF